MCLIQGGHVINQLLQGDPLGSALAEAEATTSKQAGGRSWRVGLRQVGADFIAPDAS